jgi:hypothetical protein
MTCSNIFVVERSERQHRPQLGAPAERKRQSPKLTAHSNQHVAGRRASAPRMSPRRPASNLTARD